MKAKKKASKKERTIRPQHLISANEDLDLEDESEISPEANEDEPEIKHDLRHPGNLRRETLEPAGKKMHSFNGSTDKAKDPHV